MLFVELRFLGFFIGNVKMMMMITMIVKILIVVIVIIVFIFGDFLRVFFEI